MKCNLCKWVVMSMGLMNTPDKFMHTMNNLFSNILDSSVVVFLDDILMYSFTMKERFILLEKVLAHQQQYIFY